MSENEKKTENISDKKKIFGGKATAVCSVIFIGAVSALGILLAVVPRETVSETEKRELEPFPKLTADSYFSGEFAQKLDKFYSDTVPFRDNLNEAAAVLEKARGIASPQFYGNVAVVDDDLSDEEDDENIEYTVPEYTSTELEPPAETEKITEETSVSEEETVTEITAETSETIPETTVQTEETTASETEISEEEEEFNGNINEFLNNGILVDGVKMYGEKAGIMLFGGSKKQGLRYANIISAYKKALGDDVNVYNLVVPTSVEFYLPKKFSKYSSSEKDAINYIYDNLSDDVITVDGYSALEAHSDEYIYFRTDHHWTDLGAYYAYTAFCDAAGLEAPELSEYEMREKSEKFVGSLYTFTGDITLKNNPDTFTYYMSKADYSAQAFKYDTLDSMGATALFHEYASGVNMYGMFLGGDNMHIKITTNAGTGRKIVMFKESYGNAFAPYLVDNFDEIYVIDIRYFGANAVDYIKKVGATDVLFLDNAFAANTSSLILGIENLYSSPTGTVVKKK